MELKLNKKAFRSPKEKTADFFCYVSGNFVFFAFVLISFLLGYLAWFSLGIFSISIFALMIIAALILISAREDISIPFLNKAFDKEFRRVNNKIAEEEGIGMDLLKKLRKKFKKTYIKFLYHSMLLFKDSEDVLSDLKDDVIEKFAEFSREKNKNDKVIQIIEDIRNGKEIDGANIEELKKELAGFVQYKQKQSAKYSLGALTIITICTIIIGLIASFIFPETFRTKAASYGFAQTDWSGGASTTAVALHPGDQADWDHYYSKDGVSTTTNGQLSLDFTVADRKTETANADWQTHATTNTYYFNGSIGIARPNGISCDDAAQCSSGFCESRICCNTACATNFFAMKWEYANQKEFF